MTWRPEYGWWRVTWRTILGVTATLLLTIAVTGAFGKPSGADGGTLQPPVTSPAPQPSVGEPDQEPVGDGSPSGGGVGPAASVGPSWLIALGGRRDRHPSGNKIDQQWVVMNWSGAVTTGDST